MFFSKLRDSKNTKKLKIKTRNKVIKEKQLFKKSIVVYVRKHIVESTEEKSFSFRQNDARDVSRLWRRLTEFQSRVAMTGKARSSSAECRVAGTSKAVVDAERRLVSVSSEVGHGWTQRLHQMRSDTLRATAGTAIARLSHRNSVRLSVRHTGGSGKNGAS